ncbi:hypothetical protein K443DRAFT_673379 [Laccaria amethystina LaAM-08-1]|uniref:Exocyst complex component Sec3 PIP2-binding N-terminal domain-containing protein n=1 Tax=Laccaria amethystina LaAM-08-1 TaxID=1095629 RepID=A0A0C9X5N0_9AGAR|nr:hypothetical protein K443DRAFT_673379 [Laccaria amethystina LaAM-08-1]
MADQRQKIIASVFSRRNASGNLEEAYVSHVKIWEDAGVEGGGKKPRYILLSQANNGSGFIHKSKLNTNGSFSVGKTWTLSELRAVEVVNPLAFNITLSRTYRWQTENQDDQASFLEALISLFRVITSGAPLQLDGIEVAAPVTADNQTLSTQAEAGPSRAPRLRSQTPIQNSSPEIPLAGPPQRIGPPPGADPPVNGSQDYIQSIRPGDRSGPQPVPVSPLAAVTGPARTRHPLNVPFRGQATQSISDDPPQIISGQESLIPYPPSMNASPVLSIRSQKPTVRVEEFSTQQDGPSLRRDQNARISYFDAANQATLDRLVSITHDSHLNVEAEEEDVQDTLTNVEEMIEGYEWASEDVISRKTTKGAVDLIEARLLDELMALEKANIHSFLESDDRIGMVMKFMDDAISELDSMDSLISTYKIHLNAASDDILFIQSQNRGLQVQTQNQRALLGELQNLLRTVHVEQHALVTLTQESLEKGRSIQRLEEASAELYKALQAGRDTDMAATMERLQEYRTHNSQFCKRLFDFLSIMFTAQGKLLLGETNGLVMPPRGLPTVIAHQDIEVYLGRYAGLMLYLKEMDENVYGRLCAAYFSAASELHSTQLKSLLSIFLQSVKKAPEDDQDQGFMPTTTSASKSATSIRRAGTLIRSPIENRNKDKDKDRVSDGDLLAAEVLGLLLEQITATIYREDEFITDFLQINDAGLTFADYMGLDNYFRRQATRSASLSQATMKLIRNSLDLIFGFLPAELKDFIDVALSKDSMEIVAILVTLERCLVGAEEKNNQFVLSLLGKQQNRIRNTFDRHIHNQLKGIEQTKLSSKKRKGVTHFIKHFSSYAARVESQLVRADGLETRKLVDSAYEKIVHTMFESLKHIAKMEGEGEDKGQLNYHVILIENMHCFIVETSKMDNASLVTFSQRAESIYDENLSAYVKMVLRRPFSKLIDFFDGVDRLASSNPNDLTGNSTYNKSALRKVVKEYTSKDVRKHIDLLFKRVEKHFTEGSDKTTTEDVTSRTVLAGVWKACEEELLRLLNRFSKRIAQSYSGTGITLEFTASDIEAAFHKHS